MNNLIQTLRNHKRNNTSYLILATLNIVFLAILAINIYESPRGDLIPNLAFGLAIPILVTLITLWYEKRGLSLVAHVMFFIFHLESYFKRFIDMLFNGRVPASTLYTLLGAAAAIYVILKVVAHYNELRTSAPIIGRSVGVLIIISLVSTYIDDSFMMVLIYGLLMLLGVVSGNRSDALAIVILIYATRIITVLNSAYNVIGLNSNQKLSIVINVLFALFFIYLSVKQIKEDTYINRY